LLGEPASGHRVLLAPIAAVLDIPEGRVQVIAADRADTTVEVLPANPSKSRDVQAAEQTTVAYADGVPRMTAGQQADSNIELGRLSRERELGPVLGNITVPARYVVASGTSFGSRGDEQERIRASLDAVTARNPNIRISAKVASNHGALLRKDFPAIAKAVREVAALDREGVLTTRPAD
jgi:hypothetical protein